MERYTLFVIKVLQGSWLDWNFLRDIFMAHYIIEGGRPVQGTVRPAGNKNEALPALVSCLLTTETVTLKRLPKIRDVMVMCDILADLGVEVSWDEDSSHGGHTLHLNAAKARGGPVREDLCSLVRAAILLVGPLLARFSEATLPLPGGDVIGSRRIDTHFEGMSALGVEMSLLDGKISGKLSGRPRGAFIFLDEPSVTATENILLLAVLAEGMTVIDHAACEPHVTGLARLLCSMGARIKGVGTNRLEVEGVSVLGGADHLIGCDYMEVASYASLASSSRGKVCIEGVNTEDFRGIFRTWKRLGVNAEVEGNTVIVDGTQQAQMQKDISGGIGCVYSAPWPGFPTDLMSVAIVAATQAQGSMIFFEKLFEGRMFFTDKLLKMGAQIVLCDPHRVVVTGPSTLVAARVSSPDVRAGMALIIAACVAQGTSRIGNIYQVERGYDQVVEKLSALGVAIRREE